METGHISWHTRVSAVLVIVLLLTAVHAVGVAGGTTGAVQGLYQVGAEAYALDDADPNESPEVIWAFWQGIDLVREGRWQEAISWFTDNLSRYPDSRHLHEGLAEVFWYLATDGAGGPSALTEAAKEAATAASLALGFGKVRDTWLLAQTLGTTGDSETFNKLFQQCLALAPTYETYLDYALGLSLLGSQEAEAAYRQAIALQPSGIVDGLTYYGEWLLDQGREAEVLPLLPADSDVAYVDFLRGLALERLNRLKEARTAYTRFIPLSSDFPAPGRYRIVGSWAQVGIRFIGDGTISTTEGQARVGLSALIYGESGGEAVGGQRAVGWVVRNRVLRGSVGQPPCPYVNNSGGTLADKYKSVMCQSNQFAGMCQAWCSDPSTTSCSHTPTTDQTAYNVWYGYAPDPVPSPGGYCPGGYRPCPDGVCDPCWDTCWGGVYGYSTKGGLLFRATAGICPSTCATLQGKTCGNGGTDNCFYYHQ